MSRLCAHTRVKDKIKNDIIDDSIKEKYFCFQCQKWISLLEIESLKSKAKEEIEQESSKYN